LRSSVKGDAAWGSAIRACRAQAGLGQADLARRLKMTQQDISKLETARKAIKGRDIPRVAKALGIEPRAFFDVFMALYEA